MSLSHKRDHRRHSLRFETLEKRRLLAHGVATPGAATVDDIADTSEDGVLSPLDALLTINAIQRWESNGVEPAAHLDTTADQVVDADDVDFIFALLESKWLAGQDISDPAGTTTSAEPNGSASTVGEGSGSDTRDGSTAETESLTLVSDEMTTGYIAGIYEDGRLNPQMFPGGGDNDANSEKAVFGYTAASGPGYSILPMETIDDIADQWGWTQAQKDAFQSIATVHEIGHQFGLDHSGQINMPGTRNIMTVHSSETQEQFLRELPLVFSEADRNDIRTIDFP